MRLAHYLLTLVIFGGAAGLAFISAHFSVKLIEETSEIGVRTVLDDRNYPWAEVQADGLTVALSGTAPTEADRFAAISAAGTVVDAARVIDQMAVAAAAALAAPRFSAEILRNDAGLSVIGLIPAATDRERLLEDLRSASNGDPVTELVETADFRVPEGWDDAMGFAVTVLEDLPRAKVSVSAGHVLIKAITDSEAEKAALERKLSRTAPPGLRLALNIAAPRPVITPFTLRFAKDESGTRFDACSADDNDAVRRIMSAARDAGLESEAPCTIGMGVPSPNWSLAAALSIDAVNALGMGTVTFSDADITLVAAEGTEEALFDRIVGELENALPPVFALYAKLPETPEPNQGPPEFTVTLSPEGLVQLRGRLSDESLRTLADSYARAAFGSADVYTAARIVPDLPSDWSLRVLTGIEALAQLSNGFVRVTPDEVRVTGNTGFKDTTQRISSLLAEKLGQEASFSMDVTYQEALDPVIDLPTPEECIADIDAIQASGKISFEPGSATIDSGALDSVDAIAEILQTCGQIRLEIQGHTDSQGRETMNLNLSQARAQSVLNELRARRVVTSSFTAKGYGETNPIADNDSEAGREANRRIEFVLLQVASSESGETTLESLAGNDETPGNEDTASGEAAE